MPAITPIQPHQTAEAKRLIYTVAKEIFDDPRPLEEMISQLEAEHELGDMDDIQRNYFENGGTFLVMSEGERIIGSGALRKLDEVTCELKRLWFLPEYHGKGHGWEMLNTLMGIARQMGYQKIRLETDAVYQSRAVRFYQRAGFHQIPRDSDDPGDIAMEMAL
jgi:putative acetyltransferase